MVIALVLASFVPIALFIKNAEGNFKKAEVKKIASRRRQRLDAEHGVNREQMEGDFNKLDEMFRVSEKEEIKKYLELGKTPAQYYEEQAARGVPRPGVTIKSLDGTKDKSIESVRETLMSMEEDDGVNISVIKGRSKTGESYEQVKVSASNGAVPDPRIAGAQIFFDSRLDR